MKIGIPVPNVDKPGGAGPILAVAKLADSSGFDSVWLGDHIVRPTGKVETSYWKNKPNRYQGELFEPMVTAGYVAGVTQNVRIGFGVLVLPYRNPVVIAKSIASLDQLSAGRMILGVGSGYWKEEFRVLGIPFEDRVAKYKESVQLLRDMWASDTPSHHGKYWQVDEILFRPRPVQDPVPIWIGGVTQASLEYAVAVADGWHPARFRVDTLRPLVDRLHEIAAAAGRDLSNFTICNRPACPVRGQGRRGRQPAARPRSPGGDAGAVRRAARLHRRAAGPVQDRARRQRPDHRPARGRPAARPAGGDRALRHRGPAAA